MAVAVEQDPFGQIGELQVKVASLSKLVQELVYEVAVIPYFFRGLVL